ncbi:MAG TPA: hemin uptake protein HemP [Rhodospirillaceae bacterium]|nr:hemin uptake protein HemP [Rhodospirillaceae bacterium]MAX62712.1 hemin uptake protein HemP [Rhodospirillaceae bacterium]MBB57509.1 hemin uptake protein HemP [Rhodospirillaceae bacterium]HAE01205.1 hemin uptake protein HemP [Rhodospirillaceae bacterium]HAJ22971.1 hemin uptake protein HemP [Rhodospirillaceae bacterium]|tara:strand:+ start:1222 stop:1386 length:165 start_codon:yes stop_codon:yes gene_type:complete
MTTKQTPNRPGLDSDPLVVTSDALLQNRNEVVIEHRGEQYRLRRTRQDKLILTK